MYADRVQWCASIVILSQPFILCMQPLRLHNLMLCDRSCGKQSNAEDRRWVLQGGSAGQVWGDQRAAAPAVRGAQTPAQILRCPPKGMPSPRLGLSNPPRPIQSMVFVRTDGGTVPEEDLNCLCKCTCHDNDMTSGSCFQLLRRYHNAEKIPRLFSRLRIRHGHNLLMAQSNGVMALVFCCAGCECGKCTAASDNAGDQESAGDGG